jgi:RNA polymerase sigma-70 factor (ECF subfamily)
MDAANDALARRNDFLGREFQHSYGWLTTSVHRVVGSRNDAEDLAASAFTELAAFDDLQGVRQPRALLTTIARRLTFEFWRRRDLERAWLAELAARPEPRAPSAEEVCLSLQEIARIDAALVRLPSRVREAVVLGHVEEWPHARIADRLGVSVSMIRKYLAQAAQVCRQAA